MPELPEVETVRRMLASHVVGRSIARVRLSGKKLRTAIPRTFSRRLSGRSIRDVDRHGKYLLMRLDDRATLVSHLGMSGRWLFYPEPPTEAFAHVHVRLLFVDGSELWFQDPRRFGLLRWVSPGALARDPFLAILGPDPFLTPPTGQGLGELARGTTIEVKNFLLDQRRIAGVGNIYASEILHRAGVDPRRKAGRVRPAEWDRIAREIPQVLGEAVDHMGTTFSMYRTLWNEPGGYTHQLRVYDRAGEPCRACKRPIRRIVQGQRSTYYCPHCQGRRPRDRGRENSGRAGARAPRSDLRKT